MVKNNKKFALIGVAGYIAERHLRAIKDTGNTLVASLDKFDCVGKIDNYFPDSDFFTEYERFDRHIDKLKRKGKKIDYVSICTPNYLHDSHIRFALRQGAEAICEKPVVLNPWNIDALQEIEKETGKKVNNILQLRLHPSIIELKQKIEKAPKDKIFDIDLTYITSRGNWYFISWKGNHEKSGGVATNIGVHFYDMLTWIFGDVKENIVHVSEDRKAAGYLKLKKANVRWFLSVDFDDLPQDIKQKGQRTYRSITVENEDIEFSGGFTDLHTQTYQQILDGKGYGLEETKKSIETVFQIRNATPVGLRGDYHPILKNI
ncbi:MAG TPA: Gfo/Idh/MocA family oxidoreductase [Bacteroidales bacterium]|nr:Gfo/Idh/MocA family oxidoreductase [Bacteroidales bacterium]